MSVRGGVRVKGIVSVRDGVRVRGRVSEGDIECIARAETLALLFVHVHVKFLSNYCNAVRAQVRNRVPVGTIPFKLHYVLYSL